MQVWRWPASAPRRSGLNARLYASNAPGARKKMLVAIFQRGAADGLNIVVPHGERRYYDLAPLSRFPALLVPIRGIRRSISMASSACIRRSRR